MRDKVSVIMACYNAENFIAETISSVLGQTYESIELICVDDGSTDRTREILQEFAGLHQNIRWLAHPGGVNRGQASSLNLGLSRADAPFIALLDADDIWHPKKTELQVAQLKANPTSHLSYCNGDRIDADGNFLWPFLSKEHIELGVPEAILLDCYIAPAAVLFRRDLLDQIGGLEEGLMTSDHDFFVRAAELSPLIYLPEKLWKYRLHGNQTSRSIKCCLDSFKTVERAESRRRYPRSVIRRRRAVCYFTLAQAQQRHNMYFGALASYLIAGLLDPIRATKVLTRRE